MQHQKAVACISRIMKCCYEDCGTALWKVSIS